MIQLRQTMLFILFIGLSLIGYANTQDMAFRHLTIDNGLSNSNVNCIVQDRNGFIWLGTENGLNKYDGYNFTHYFSDINKKNSLASNEILSLLIDSDGRLWVGTFQGLFVYNELKDNFDHLSFTTVDQSSTNIPVYALLEDGDSIIWVGTSGKGLFKYVKNKGFVEFFKKDSVDESANSSYIYTLYKDSDDILWVGTTDNGLEKFNIKTGKFNSYKPIENVNNLQNVNAILSIYRYSDYEFLLGTRGDGLFKFDQKTGKFSIFELNIGNNKNPHPKEIYNMYTDTQKRMWIATHGDGLYKIEGDNIQRFEHDENDPKSLINNNIRTIFEDRQGNLWIVSFQGGVNVLPNTHKSFNTHRFNEDVEFASNIITSMAVDKKGNFWVGTDGGGLKYLDRKRKKEIHYLPGEITDDKVVMSMMLEGNNLWLGTYTKGISVFNLRTKKVKTYETSDEEGSLSNNFISCYCKTKVGDIWVGTLGGGMCRYNPESETFENFNYSDGCDQCLVNSYVNAIVEDNNGRLWIGTFWGISVYDPFDGMFTRYLQNNDVKNGLSNNTIYSIKITSKNEIWLGTRNGLNKFIPERNSFQSFNLADGLPGNVIFSIEEDNSGNLWLSTNNGICNFNTTTFESRNYYKSDGLPSNEFFRRASYFTENGELIFGSLNGLVSFYPDSLNQKYDIPKATLTKFRIFDQELVQGEMIDNQIILDKPIYNTETIELKSKFNSFAFEFSALDFIRPEKNLYKYKMEGFDADWRILPSDKRYVTYTNLDPGTYTFKVKASSIDNRWSDDYSSVELVVKPPWYSSWAAFISYYIIIMLLVWFLWTMSIKRIKLQNLVEFERLERDKDNELNQAKLQFFTNISHEFRTPITLIVGPLEKMMNDKTIGKKYGQMINLMLKNANRLLRLVNQLMDLRKVEMGKMKLKTEKADIVKFLKDIYNSFGDLALQKNIDFSFVANEEEINCWFDPDKIDKIFFNLLSNAFKFTPQNGNIALVIELVTKINHGEYLKISVKDSGKGIAKEDQPKIFERFYQTNDKNEHHNMGSGVGLSLTKSLIEQHHSFITLESEPNKGATFIVSIPLDETMYADDEKFTNSTADSIQYTHSTPDIIDEEDLKVNEPNEKSQTILVVEDNYDLRKYIVSEFNDRYNILEAANGKEALDIALQDSPDLIISDVVMPEMDGLEFCKKVKENFLTNHIPIILLTARSSIEHRIEGLGRGADSYIPKPFNLEYLKMRVKKLIELRQVLKNKYAAELDSPKIQKESEDDVYLKELKDLVLKRIDDPDLNIEKICAELGISRAHFYRKIKLITDKSPTEYVRIIRLTEAAKLFLNTNKSVSEVCYQVGFSSPSYFSICFKEHFKTTPVEFLKKQKK